MVEGDRFNTCIWHHKDAMLHVLARVCCSANNVSGVNHRDRAAQCRRQTICKICAKSQPCIEHLAIRTWSQFRARVRLRASRRDQLASNSGDHVSPALLTADQPSTVRSGVCTAHRLNSKTLIDVIGIEGRGN
jgi:hypothetical protein